MSSSLAPYGDQIEKTLRLAARRKLWIDATEQCAWIVGILLSSFILLLLLGTALLGSFWFTLVVIASFAVAVFQVRRRMTSRYRLAQLIDRKLLLHDALSTAHFLLSNPAVQEQQAARFQLEQANRLAASVQVEDAFPFQASRSWMVCAALLVVSGGLFAYRYFVTQSLSLHPALMTLQMQPVIERLEKAFQPSQERHKSITARLPRQYTPDPIAPDHKATTDTRNLPTEATPPAEAGDRNGELTKGQTQNPGKGSQQKQDAKQEARAGNQASSQPSNNQTMEERNEPQANSPSHPSNKEQQSNTAKSSPGLVNRMKDALSSMMEKVRANGAPQQPGQQRSEQQNQDQAQNSQKAAGDKASSKPGQGSNQQPNAQNQESSENQNTDGQAQGQTSERPQNSQARSSGQSSSKGADAQSGVGRQDGDKAIQDAEQLRAMGKLAEIIGKRSVNLTGDMTVETPSGKQQLKTAYSQQTGRHSDAGGEINRNEIPMEYQQYVRDYMEQVGKQREKAKP